MGQRTGIEWPDSTINPEMGCAGCELWAPEKGIRICYAGVSTERMLRNGPRKGWPPSFGAPTLFPERILEACRWKDLRGTDRPDKPWLNGMPRVIFACDMGDAWTDPLPVDWLAPYLDLIATSDHLWLFLTKRPDRAADFSRMHLLPENMWLGTSVTSPQDARIRALKRARAALLFVSFEPVLRPARLTTWFPGIRWVIAGGASGAEAPLTELNALRAALDDCRAANVPAFIKQIGSRPARAGVQRLWPRDRKGGDPEEWPCDLRVREFPR